MNFLCVVLSENGIDIDYHVTINRFENKKCTHLRRTLYWTSSSNGEAAGALKVIRFETTRTAHWKSK